MSRWLLVDTWHNSISNKIEINKEKMKEQNKCDKGVYKSQEIERLIRNICIIIIRMTQIVIVISIDDTFRVWE